MSSEPLVSIVTPSFNMGAFLEETIRSVFAQDYPRIQYIVMDGGSTDGTVALLERFAPRLEFVSGRDGGAADAINRGLARARGEIFAWIGADDLYLPNAVSSAVAGLRAHPAAAGVYGDGEWIDEAGAVLGPYPTRSYDRALFRTGCFICQPAVFLRAEAVRQAGGLDASLQFTFDYDLWIRMGPLARIPGVLARSRMHRRNKTLGQREGVYLETFRLLQRHFGYVPFDWIYAWCCYRRDGRDQFFEPLHPSLAAYAASLPHGLWKNWRHPGRYAAEWARVMSWKGLLRRLR